MKKSKMKFFSCLLGFVLLFSSLLLTSCGKDDKAQPASDNTSKDWTAFTDTIQAKIKEHWPYMHTVWPGYQYDSHNLILFHLNDDASVKEAWLLNTKEKRKLEEKEYDNMIPPQPGGFEKCEFDKKPSISMSADAETLKKSDSAQQFYLVATHELTHLYYQQQSDGITEDSDRSQVFPVDTAPRLYRQMIFQNLILAYENPEQDATYLGQARYWLDKWKTDFSDEYHSIKATDIAESTARYSENVGSFIGPDTTPEKFRQEAIKMIPKNKIFLSADDESYEIGYVAALLLDAKSPDWKNSFYKENVTAEEKLLQNVDAIPQEMDSQIEKKVKDELLAYNNKVQKTIENLIQAKKDPAVPYLKIDITDSMSSMSASDMIRYENQHILVKYGNQFTAEKKDIKINQVNVFEKYSDEGRQYIYIPLQMPYELKDNVLTVKTDDLRIDSIKVTKEEEEGRTIYSVKADS